MNIALSLNSVEPAPVEQRKTLRLGMAELTPNGLSEQWMLRYGGDAHWSLIAKALGLSQAVFRDRLGRAVYAAFCSTSLELMPVPASLLGEDITIESALYRVGNHQIGSDHDVCFQGRRIARLSMISTFVSHEDSTSNRSIVRNKDMPFLALPQAPRHLTALKERSRERARTIKAIPVGETVFETRLCPNLDFNAVGLLYFPSFSKFAAIADAIKKPEHIAQTREVTYLGNADFNDTVGVFSKGNGYLLRRGDGMAIATIS